MKTQADTMRQVLTNYLSAQPDRTALNRDCRRVVNEALGREPGREVNHTILGRIANELGITKRGGSLSGKQGDTFITYWTLPAERSSLITDLDREMAEGLILATARKDSKWAATCLDYSEQRPKQVLTAMAQIAANGQAPAE